MSDAAATTTPRERYRQQVRAEIKERAREQIAAAGTSALSLNKIAKEMGLSGAALYRYFTGRDELLSELVQDASQSLVDTFRAVAGRGEGDLDGLAQALRAWALADPQRYFLLYGPPVPGYRGTAGLTSTMSEIMGLVLSACDAVPREASRAPVVLHLDRSREDLAPASALGVALVFWTRLHGVLSLELSGHFLGMGFDPALLYEAELSGLSSG
ncbi:TetR/AcrR family transcriptional regulator [Streptomyces erythrochromogenes]|uniref:TetR/AcrR family transcriptional regulator n=1 Tax=Streptomyces erythrochromogenes TaxID=285574 RepID=UPI0036B6345D